MVDTLGDEILLELLGEVEGYLPDIRSCLATLKQESDNRSAIDELHRIYHTIKGAASMVNLPELSKTAALLEDTIENISETHLVVNKEMIGFIEGTTRRVENFCTLTREGRDDKGAMYNDTLADFQTLAANWSSDGEYVQLEGKEKQEPLSDDLFGGEVDESLDHIFNRISDHCKENDTQESESDESDDGFFDLLDDDAADDDSFDLFDEQPEEGDSRSLVDIDPELLQGFNEEAGEHFKNIEKRLKDLSNSITGDVILSGFYRKKLNSIRRSVHTIKGSSAVIGLENIAAWGETFEDFLDWLHDESDTLAPEHITSMQEGTDLLATIVNEPAVARDDEKEKLGARFAKIIQERSIQKGSDEPPDLQGSGAEADNDDFFDLLNDDAVEDDSFDLFEEHPEESGSTSLVAVDPELLQSFNEEAGEHFENINTKLNDLSNSITGDVILSGVYRKKLNSIRRSVHTIKGASAVIGLENVAAWGHTFEDFLDWLHDESDTLAPKSITSMLEGTDLLATLVNDPSVARADEKESLGTLFAEIIQERLTLEGSDVSPDLQDKREPDDTSSADVLIGPDASQPVMTTPSAFPATSPKEKKKTATLRVNVEQIDQMVGLSGDMAINLSGFSGSMSVMVDTRNELNTILRRLKNISSSLEAGYELAMIPHLAGGDSEGDGITEDFDPLEMDRYSELNILIRSLKEVVVDLDSMMSQADMVNTSWQKMVEKQQGLLRDIQDSMTVIRMTPFSTLSNRLYKTVREAEKFTGYSARLTISGQSLRMDTRVWDTMADPLMHILRNAVAHGGSREKPLTVRIQASRLGSQCCLKISDTGKGLDYDVIRRKGIEKYPGTGVESMTDKELAELIFKHGFSSASSITSLAGRGVGMDVVRTAIEKLNGSVKISSVQGEGVHFTILLPITVAQLPAIMARFGRQICAIPMRDVHQVLRASDENSVDDEFEFDGEMVPLLQPKHIWQAEKIGLGSAVSESGRSEPAIVLVEIGGRRGALLCDEIQGRQELIFKDLGSHLGSVPCISGISIMGDGRLIPILNVGDLLREEKSLVQLSEVKKSTPLPAENILTILIADDSISVRKVLSNFIFQQGWRSIMARDGIEAIEQIREQKPDLVLLDIEMPRMNGFEVLQALQAQQNYQAIPVIMLSSRSADKYREKASNLGASGFATKPFQDEELAALISELTVV